MDEQIRDKRRYRTGFTIDDKKEFMRIAIAELERNGIKSEDVSLLSPVAITVQAMSNFLDNISVVVGNISRENSLIHAQRYSSLMNQLAQHSNEVVIAKPSRIDMFVRIPLSDVLIYGSKTQANTWELRYNDKNTCTIDGLKFMPVEKEYIIKVTRNPDGSLSPRVYVDKNGKKNDILVQMVEYHGAKILGFKASFKQIEIDYKEFIFNDDQLQMFLIEEDQPISDIFLYYRNNSGEEYRSIGKKLYFTRGGEDYLEYKIEAQNKIRIDYKHVQGGFKPVVGGMLKVEIHMTYGRDVRTTVPAEPEIVDTYMTHVDYEPVGVDYFESSGGRLAITDRESLRNFIIKINGARRRIDTDSDMKTFLLNYQGESKFEPKLVLNDVKHRIWNIYATLSFRSDTGSLKRTFTVPTNTSNLTMKKEDLYSRTIKGDTYYCMNDTHALKSTQTRANDFTTIVPGMDPMTATIPSNVGNINISDPSSIVMNYYYITPFIFSYDPKSNFLRSYAMGQYDIPYLSFSTFESYTNSAAVRFINTSIRVNDYLDFTDETHTASRNVYEIRAQMRCEANEDYTPILGTTFQATMRVKTYDRDHDIHIYATSIEKQEDDKWDVVFKIDTDRKIWGDIVEITYRNDLDNPSSTETSLIRCKSEVELEFTQVTPKVPAVPPEYDAYGTMIKPGVPEIPRKFQKINVYRSTVEFFKDITESLYIQTSVSIDGLFRFVAIPMVEMEFWRSPKNRMNIVTEIDNIAKFIKSEVYDELDMYSLGSMNLHDRLETLFRVSIKFTKTHGLSKFLDVGNTVRRPIINLQVSPTAYIRKLDQDFDESGIASQLNQKLITHDYLMSDFNLNAIVFNTMDKAGDSVDWVQFKNLDNYPADHLTIMRNNNKTKNWDPPEVISVKPVYVPAADNYKFNMTFIDA